MIYSITGSDSMYRRFGEFWWTGVYRRYRITWITKGCTGE